MIRALIMIWFVWWLGRKSYGRSPDSEKPWRRTLKLLLSAKIRWQLNYVSPSYWPLMIWTSNERVCLYLYLAFFRLMRKCLPMRMLRDHCVSWSGSGQIMLYLVSQLITKKMIWIKVVIVMVIRSFRRNLTVDAIDGWTDGQMDGLATAAHDL